MKWHKNHKGKNNNLKFDGLDSSAKGNPFTTPPGYFDSMSSDIMKTVGTVSLFALFRLKPMQIAVGVVTTIAVATAIYFFASSDSNKKDNNIVPQTNQMKPKVVVEENSNQPISLIPSTSPDVQAIVVIDSRISRKEIIYQLNQLPVPKSMKEYLTDEYSLQIANYFAPSDKGPDNQELILDSEPDEIVLYIPDQNNGNSSGNQNRTLSAFEMLPRDTCSEHAMTLRAYFPGVSSYSWSTGATTPEILVEKSGAYRVTLTLENGKRLSKSVSVKVIPSPTLNNDYLITACTGSILRLSVAQKNSGYQYYWPQYKLSTQQLTVSKPGLYYANVTGCQTYVDSFFVVFTHCELGIPNMVTPNGDGLNETFSITNLSKYPNTELCIYDKSNKLVYKSLNYQNDWDATATPDGSYFFILKFTDGSTQEGLITVKH